jgi:hypothetical protein
MMTTPLAARDDDHLLLSHCYENSLLSTRASTSLASIGCILLLHRLWVDLERVAYTPAWFLTQPPAAHQTHTHTHTRKTASQNKTRSQQQLRIDDDDDYEDPSAAAKTQTQRHTQQQQQQQQQKQKLLTKTLKIK